MLDHPNAPPRLPGRIRKIPLWVLIVAFFAGLIVLHLLKPAVARAQFSPDSTALLTWTAPGDDGAVGRATSYDLRYRTIAISGTDTTTWWNAATQVSGEPAPRTSGSVDSMRVRSLTPLTTYYFMLRAADEVPNWSGYSNVAVKTTTGGDNTAPAAIADLSVTSVTGVAAALRWTAPGDDGTTGTATTYDVRYSTATITTANWGSASQATGEPSPLVAGTVQTFTLTGLSPGQTYFIAVRTLDERSNLSALSNVVNTTTLDTIPPAPVRDLSQREAPRAGDPIARVAASEDASRAL